MQDPMLDHAVDKDIGHTPEIHSSLFMNFGHWVAPNRNRGCPGSYLGFLLDQKVLQDKGLFSGIQSRHFQH